MEWMLLPYKRYADFSGRSCRKEFWLFYLWQALVYTVLITFILMAFPWGNADAFKTSGPSPVLIGLIGLAVLFAIVNLCPSLAVHVRRFHDQDKSGWFYALAFIPYVGSLVVLVFMCLGGTRGANRYGEDPLGRGLAEVFA
jgi:uncharacterized membrane protein YhaH (DUF805 family)